MVGALLTSEVGNHLDIDLETTSSMVGSLQSLLFLCWCFLLSSVEGSRAYESHHVIAVSRAIFSSVFHQV